MVMTQTDTPTPQALAVDFGAFVHWPEVRRITGATSQTVREWVAAGKFPKPIESFPGTRFVWRRSDIDAFVQDHCAK